MQPCKPSHAGPSFRGLGIYAWVHECSNQEIAQSEMAVTACFSAFQCIADHRDLLQERVVDFSLEWIFYSFCLFFFVFDFHDLHLPCFIFHYTIPLSETMDSITTPRSLNNSLSYSKRNCYFFLYSVSPLPKTRPDLYQLL